MKLLPLLPCLAAALLAPLPGRAAVLLQTPAANFVAWEAETNVTLTAGTPTSFVITNDPTPSGSTALFTTGPLGQGTDFPRGFASYSIKFSTPGLYRFFYRWRANPNYGMTDANTGNSFRMPNKFNATTVSSIDANVDYVVSSGNNVVAYPASGTYNLLSDNQLLEVTQAQIDAGAPLVFTMGTREAGMTFDRFVLSLESALTEAQFNALPNSDTDVFVQPSGVNFVAWEAESPKLRLTAGTPTSFVITNDPTPSGSTALFTTGPLGQGTDFPRGFASYSIRFSTPGLYKFFYRWRANPNYGMTDANTGNSFRMPNKFNATTVSSIDANVDYVVSSGNNVVAYPASGTYNLLSDNQLLEVTQAQIDAGAPLVFTMGTREAGMTFDRFVLTLESTLTEAQFNALPNTGSDPTPPQIVSVTGSASLANVTLLFSESLDEFSVTPDRFTLNGGVGVLDATFDTVGLRTVTLTTTPQTPGNTYVVTVNGVADLSGNPIAANSQASFTAWRLATGWMQRELYLEITGSAVADLVNSPKYPNQPDLVDAVKGAAFSNSPRRNNFGARLTFFFVPPTTGLYDFHMYSDDAAELYVSLDETESQLSLLLSTGLSTQFDPNVKGGFDFDELTAGQRYLVRVLYKQGTGDTSWALTARLRDDTTPVTELPPLAGNRIQTYVNPDSAVLIFSAQPQNVTTTPGRRARFFTEATSPGGTVTYQWQLNGVDIPGATRQAYTTPPLGFGDTGKRFRCIVSGGGIEATSAEATLTVVPGSPPTAEPFIGVNFVGGNTADNQPGGTLRVDDVFGVVPQDHYNNVTGVSADGLALLDAAGNSTTVTLTYQAFGTHYTGTGQKTADHVAYDGYIHNNNAAMNVTLGNVPPGVYHLIAYSVGFAFNASYEQAFTLTGTQAYPTLHVKSQIAPEWLPDPVFRRMASTDANARDLGNYVMYESISPDAGGSLLLNLTPESPNPGINAIPALNALQLVRALAALTIAPGPGVNQATVSWNAAAAGYTLEASSTLGPTAVWTPVNGAANPLPGAGSVALGTGGANRFVRLKKP